MSLLPSRGPETSTAQEGELQVVGVDEEVAPIFDALSSETARDVLNAIYEDPGTPSEIANRLDMSIQKVSYHLENLAEVDLIAVAGTRYSEKGQEMTVYEPPEEPLVLFVGTEDRKRTLRSLVKRVVPTLGVLAVASAVVQSVYGGGLGLGIGEEPTTYSGREPPDDAGGGNGDAAGPAGREGDDAPTEDVGIAAEDADTSAGTETPASTDLPQDTPPEATETPVAETTGPQGADGGVSSADASEATPTEMVEDFAGTPEAAVDATVAIEPGLAFFLGGVFVLAVVGLVWYARAR